MTARAHLACDLGEDCEERWPESPGDEHRSVADLETGAEAAGWVLVDGWHACPTCWACWTDLTPEERGP